MGWDWDLEQLFQVVVLAFKNYKIIHESSYKILQFANIVGHGGQDFDKPNYRWKWDLAIPVNDVKQLFGKKILLYNTRW